MKTRDLNDVRLAKRRLGLKRAGHGEKVGGWLNSIRAKSELQSTGEETRGEVRLHQLVRDE